MPKSEHKEPLCSLSRPKEDASPQHTLPGTYIFNNNKITPKSTYPSQDPATPGEKPAEMPPPGTQVAPYPHHVQLLVSMTTTHHGHQLEDAQPAQGRDAGEGVGTGQDGGTGSQCGMGHQHQAGLGPPPLTHSPPVITALSTWERHSMFNNTWKEANAKEEEKKSRADYFIFH